MGQLCLNISIDLFLRRWLVNAFIVCIHPYDTLIGSPACRNLPAIAVPAVMRGYELQCWPCLFYELGSRFPVCFAIPHAVIGIAVYGMIFRIFAEIMSDELRQSSDDLYSGSEAQALQFCAALYMERRE